VDFGPRNPKGAGHEACKNWLAEKLQAFDLDVQMQSFSADLPDGTTYNATNIIGRYRQELPRRILLCAHWDTRFKAEKDPNPADRDTPILGADDGASGVGVILELARTIQSQPLDMGVDIVFFDAEDQGLNGGENESWCQGSQYWSNNLPAGQRPMYGVLLDMVGAKGATFPKEGVSMHYAPHVVEKVWNLGQSMGYGHYFVQDKVAAITDDHLFINQITGIPTIDIINYPNGRFGHYHHTQADDMSVIDRNTLRAVGQVMLAMLYQESVQAL
jgi:Zn-dependent M28 family amino/carboxypeptidase